LKPVLTKSDQLGDHYEHPAFGCITLSQPLGARSTAFMSASLESEIVEFEVKTADMTRFASSERMIPGRAIVRAYMTRQQLSDLVSSHRMGASTPCTLTWTRQDGRLPALELDPIQDTFTAELEAEMKELTDKVGEIVSTVEAELTAAKVAKSRQAAILAPIIAIQTSLKSSLPRLNSELARSLATTIDQARSLIQQHASETLGSEKDCPVSIP